MQPRHDYIAVGHVTVDVLEDGTRQAGGTALYSALQAARLGCRTLVLTRGVPSQLEQLLSPYAAELELHVQPAASTTTLHTAGAGAARRQRMLAWAGPIAGEPKLDARILHLAPVARELPHAWRGRQELVGLTPQGLARAWARSAHDPTVAGRADATHGDRDAAGEGAPVVPAPVGRDDQQLATRCNAIVLGEREHDSCAALIAAARDAGALVAITDGPHPTTLLGCGATASAREPVAPVREVVDDLGAGDVFAAAFFIALADGQDARAAARFASAAAAVRLGGRGAAAIGDRTCIERRLREAVGSAR